MTKFKKFWDIKAFVLAFEVAFAFCFFLGIFWHYPTRSEELNQNRWHYINRGYPISWAGVTKSSLPVDFPLIKAPFLERQIFGDSYTKIIDLSIFFPLFLVVFLTIYSFTFIISKAAKENENLKVFLMPFYLFLTAVFTVACIFFYFFWFPRI